MWHHGIECTCAQAATHHQHTQRASASGKPVLRLGLFQEFGAQGVAHPLPLVHDLGKGGEDAAGHQCQGLVGHTGHRVLLVQHQRFTHQRTHQPARHGDVTTQTDQHVGFDAAHHAQALTQGAQQPHGQRQQRAQTLAPHARKIQGFEREAFGWYEAAFHAIGCAQPVHAPAAFTQRLGHGQAGENVATGTAGHDQGATAVCTHALGRRRCIHVLPAHTRPPCISCRFSKSIRNTIAMATILIRMADPP